MDTCLFNTVGGVSQSQNCNRAVVRVAMWIVFRDAPSSSVFSYFMPEVKCTNSTGTKFECTKLTYIRAPVGSGALKFKARIAAFVGTNYNKHGDVHCHRINSTTWDFYDEVHGKI